VTLVRHHTLNRMNHLLALTSVNPIFHTVFIVCVIIGLSIDPVLKLNG